ncbi:MAG: Mut7-C RNAse domain-containing protein [Desulfobacteraceae bacterium]|nr:Mut7-C RNAse domain-containing protein [Desulfobacteraceae bacterium]
MTTKHGAETRFAVDIMLGKLAKWLRVLGFDASTQVLRDRERMEALISEGRVPVTKREKWRDLAGIVFIQRNKSFDQLAELLSTQHLCRDDFRPFTRCSVCNSALFAIPRDAAFGKVPDYVFETASDFRKCPECARIYWPGSHKARMLEKLQSITGREGEEEGEKCLRLDPEED